MALTKQEWLRFFKDSQEWQEIAQLLEVRAIGKDQTMRTASPDDKGGAGFAHRLGTLQGASSEIRYMLNNLKDDLIKDKP